MNAHQDITNHVFELIVPNKPFSGAKLTSKADVKGISNTFGQVCDVRGQRALIYFAAALSM